MGDNKMKLIYDKPKGKRFNRYFWYIEALNYWWSIKYKRWVSESSKPYYDGAFSSCYSCKSVKAFKRHIKNHPELSGEVTLVNKYKGYDVKVIIPTPPRSLLYIGGGTRFNSGRKSRQLLYVNKTRSNNGYDYTSTQSNESDSVFDYDKIMDAINSIPKDPLEELANKHGFSIKDGDILMMPIAYKHSYSNIRGVRFSPHITEPYFMKNPNNIEFEKPNPLTFNMRIPIRRKLFTPSA